MKMRPSPPPEPENAEEFNDRGNRYSRNGAYEQAIEDYSRAIGLDPGFAEAYFNRGVSKYELGLYGASIEDLTQAIDLNPLDDNYYGRRSLAYLFNDQPELAEQDQDICDELRNKP